jgi:hypothetical protein
MIFREAGVTNDPTQPFCFPDIEEPPTRYFANINAKMAPSNRDDISHVASTRSALSHTPSMSPKVVFHGGLNPSTVDSSHWGLSP